VLSVGRRKNTSAQQSYGGRLLDRLLKIWELLTESGRVDEKRVIAILVHETS